MKWYANRSEARIATPQAMAKSLGEALQRTLADLQVLPAEKLLERRDARLAAFGVFSETPA
jgi:acetyl-CoA carboxylase alpha subunit